MNLIMHFQQGMEMKKCQPDKSQFHEIVDFASYS